MDLSGAQIHTVVQKDPLELRAVKLDIGVWAHPMDEEEPPGPESMVFVVYNNDEDKWYWVGTVYSVQYVGYNQCIDLDSLLDMYEEPEEDYDDADWWKRQ